MYFFNIVQVCIINSVNMFNGLNQIQLNWKKRGAHIEMQRGKKTKKKIH